MLKFLSAIRTHASVAELADALDSKSSFFGSVGSTPTGGIRIKAEHLYRCSAFVVFGATCHSLAPVRHSGRFGRYNTEKGE